MVIYRYRGPRCGHLVSTQALLLPSPCRTHPSGLRPSVVSAKVVAIQGNCPECFPEQSYGKQWWHHGAFGKRNASSLCVGTTDTVLLGTPAAPPPAWEICMTLALIVPDLVQQLESL